MNFVDGKTTNLDALEAYLEKAIGNDCDLHGKVVVFGSGKCRTCPPEVKYLDAYENLVKACRLTGEIAGRYGIRVVIEPLSRKETNMVCTVAEGALLQRNVANENVGCWPTTSIFAPTTMTSTASQPSRTLGISILRPAMAGVIRCPASKAKAMAMLFAALHTAGYNGRMSIEGKQRTSSRTVRPPLTYLKQLEAQNNG